MPAATLTTERLVLRPWREGDAAAAFAINGDPAAMRHMAGTMDRAENDAWCARIAAHVEAHGWGFWVLEPLGGGGLIGVAGLMRIPWTARFTPAVEIGWRIAPSHQRQGFAAEAARAALGFGFERLGLEEIVAFTAAGNVASWRLMEKLGMRADGAFDHPNLALDHPRRRHVLYRLARSSAASA